MNGSMAAPDQRLSAASIAGKPVLVLKSSEFRKGREDGWRELETLVGRVERRGARLLSLYELQRLPILYRAALSSLSVARTIALEELRAHAGKELKGMVLLRPGNRLSITPVEAAHWKFILSLE